MAFPAMLVCEAVFPVDAEALKAVINEYIRWLDMDLSGRGFAREMADFERIFTLPEGLFLVARDGAVIAGCVGLLRYSGAVAEVKRLYVRPEFRGRRLGKQLMLALIERARSLGFRRLILDAVPQTTMAQGLYRSLGFEETSAYYSDPVSGTRFFALSLSV